MGCVLIVMMLRYDPVRVVTGDCKYGDTKASIILGATFGICDTFKSLTSRSVFWTSDEHSPVLLMLRRRCSCAVDEPLGLNRQPKLDPISFQQHTDL